MSTHQTVLLVGGTGRTGKRVLTQLLRLGLNVRVIVRSAQRLPAGVADDPKLTVLEADLLSLSDADLISQARGCDAIISCLGHVISLKGIFGPPRDLVTRAATRLCRAIETLRPATPVKYILHTSVSVNHPGGSDTRRGWFEQAFIWLIRQLIPPSQDNQQAANFLHGAIGMANRFVEWVVVRPDSLMEGEQSPYTLHESLVTSVFKPDHTNMANIAHFMTRLVTDSKAWAEWKGKLPVIINAVATKSP